MKLHEHILFWLDSQIRMGEGGLFWNIRTLGGLPFIPCILVAALWFDTAAGRTAAIIVGLALCIPWNALIIHRYRKKKETWVEPTRFSDRSGGY
jgi:hypothetical protein